jgi:CheY-like chemotaxis protein
MKTHPAAPAQTRQLPEILNVVRFPVRRDNHAQHGPFQVAGVGMLGDESPRPARILLCDDSPVERLALAHFLRGAGYNVDEAGDGDAAILHMKHREVDLVLLDLHMPEIDGFGVLTYLQEHRRALPVILLSGMPLHKIQHKMHELPTPELPPLLIKPIDTEQLLGMIELQLSGQMPEFDSTADDEAEAETSDDPNSDSTAGGTYR